MSRKLLSRSWKNRLAAVGLTAVALWAVAVWAQTVSPVAHIPLPTDDQNKLEKPAGMDIGPNGILALADRGGHKIVLFDVSKKRFLQSFGTKGDGADGLKEPTDVAVTDNLYYVADSGNKRLHIFTDKGFHKTEIRRELKKPVAVHVDDLGLIYVIDADYKRLNIYDAKGGLQRLIDGPFPGKDGKFKKPVDVTVDRAGNIFVADADRKEICVFTPKGKDDWEFANVLPLGQGDKEFKKPVSLSSNDWGELFLFDEETNAMYFRENAEPGAAWVPYVGGQQIALGEGTALATFPEERSLVYFCDVRDSRITGIQLTGLPAKERQPSRKGEEDLPEVDTGGPELAVMISQGVIVPEGTQKLYVKVTDLDGNFIEGLDQASFEVTHERRKATLKSARPFLESGEGMAILAVVETGATIGDGALDRVKTALKALIQELGSQDLLGIVTYGEGTKKHAGITLEKDKLNEAVDKLELKGMDVPLKLALVESFDLLDDNALPGRRAVILFSSGEDRSETNPELISRLANPVVQTNTVLLTVEGMDQSVGDHLLSSIAEKSGGVSLREQGSDLTELVLGLYRGLRSTYVIEYESELIDAKQDLQAVQVAIVQGGKGTDTRAIPFAAKGGGLALGKILLILLIVILGFLLIWLIVYLIARGRLLGYLTIEQGPGQGEVFQVRSRKGVKIGASEEVSDLVIDSPYVSRCHAIVYLNEEGELAITDVESVNKTALNGKELSPNEDYPIDDGDRISVARKGEGWVADLVFEAKE